MAELLIKAIDATHSDPKKDAFCWKRGDIVVAREDNDGNWGWGKEEVRAPDDGGKFVILKIPGVTLKQLRTKLATLFAADILDPPRDLNNTPTGRRILKLDIDSIPANFKQTAMSTGTVTATRDQAASFIKSKFA